MQLEDEAEGRISPFIYSLLQTRSGKEINPFSFCYEDIKIEDIAHSLSMICRFGGHCREFYSVAQHSVEVAKRLPDDYQLYGLLHDASEYLLTDLPTPIKHLWELNPYRRAEKFLQDRIYYKFGLPDQEPKELHIADKRMCATEARDLMVRQVMSAEYPPFEEKIRPLPPKEAEELFIRYFEHLQFGYELPDI